MNNKEMVRRFGHITCYLCFDYAQIEIRILAEMAGCKRLIQVINAGSDIHAEVGHDITGKPKAYFQDKLNEKPRVMIKSVHFAIIYGKQVPQLTIQLQNQGINVTEEEVQKFFDDYFRKYPEVKDFMEARREFADEHGYATTMFGFKREIAKHDENRGSFWGNQAINSPIQGTAHQLILIALAERKRKPKTFDKLRDLRMEVHDALYNHVLLRDLEEGYRQGKDLLEVQVKKGVERRFGIKLQVPLLAEAKAGFRQGALVGYEGEPLELFLPKWLKHNAKMDALINESLLEIAR